jgi:hypothetical protein
MSPQPMVIDKIRIKSAREMPRVEDHEMVQAVPADRADQPFGVRILLGTAGRRELSFAKKGSDGKPAPSEL